MSSTVKSWLDKNRSGLDKFYNLGIWHFTFFLSLTAFYILFTLVTSTHLQVTGNCLFFCHQWHKFDTCLISTATEIQTKKLSAGRKINCLQDFNEHWNSILFFFIIYATPIFFTLLIFKYLRINLDNNGHRGVAITVMKYNLRLMGVISLSWLY